MSPEPSLLQAEQVQKHCLLLVFVCLFVCIFPIRSLWELLGAALCLALVSDHKTQPSSSVDMTLAMRPEHVNSLNTVGLSPEEGLLCA